MTDNDTPQNNDIVPVKPNVKAKRHRRKRSHSYAVTNEELLYKIADAGLLCELYGINNREHRVWYFNKNPDVRAVIEQFKANGGTV